MRLFVVVTILASILQAGSSVASAPESVRKTSGGFEFRRVSAAELSDRGVTDPVAFGEAWEDPSGMIWGDIARTPAGSAKIVGQARIKLACIRYREKKREHRRKMKETAQRELDAICKIQARVRGIKGRKLFDAKLRDRKGKWKELFDEKAGKRFFYNKLSGEIRWRMPQDLLDKKNPDFIKSISVI